MAACHSGPSTTQPNPKPTPFPSPSGTIVKFGYPDEPATLDPLAPGGASSATRDILRPVLPALFSLDASMKPMADLAASYPKASDFTFDPFTVTVHLKDARWSNKQPITSSDIRYTWQKFRDGPTGYRYRPLRDVEIVAPRTVKLHFDRVVRRWWSLFSIDDMVLPMNAYTSDWGTTGPAVSGGPFAVTGWTRGLNVTLRRNPEYWGRPAPLAGIDVTFVPDDETRLQLLQRKQIDGFFAEGESNMGRRAKAYGFATVDTALTGTGGASGAFGPTWWELDLDPKRVGAGVSAAVLQAIHPTLAAEILEDSGRPMNGIPPDFTTERHTPTPWSGRGSIERATALLDQAQVPHSSPRASFQLAYARSSGAGGLAGFIHFRLQAIGVTAELEGLEPDIFEERLDSTSAPVAVLRLRRGADAPDAGDYAQPSDEPGAAPISDQVAAAISQVGTDRVAEGPVVGLSGEAWASAQTALVRGAYVAPLVRVRSWIIGRDLAGARATGTAAGPLWNAGEWSAVA